MKSEHPINDLRWIPIEDIIPNEYNPNRVALTEISLLYLSIKEDGFTQPIVVYFDKGKKKYIIIDGFHRFTVLSKYKDIRNSCEGQAPCVVLDKSKRERIASTVRHNRARGTHSVDKMSEVVVLLTEEGLSEEEICIQLGMSPIEYKKILGISGYAKRFMPFEWSKSIVSNKMIELCKKWEKEANEDNDEA